MRKADLEYIEMLLEPLRTAKDRHDESINASRRRGTELGERVTALERDRDAHSLTVEQAAHSVRSLLQIANRKLRAAEMIEPEEVPLTDPSAEGHTGPVSPAPTLTHKGRRVI